MPLAAVFLLVAVNDERLVGREGRNHAFSNAVLVVVVAVTLLLGVSAVLRAGAAALGRAAPGGEVVLTVAAVAALCLALPLGRVLAPHRRPG